MLGNPRNNGGMAGFGDRTRTQPIPVQRTTRNLTIRNLTSLNAGKMVPIGVIPLLREDSVASARMRVAFEMSETVELLMNGITVRVMAYLVPKLAFERFDGLDSINRSYEGVNDRNGQPPQDWFDTMAAPTPGSNAILTALGKHARAGQIINTEYIEAYNAIWNFRARNRSPDIELRTRLESTLAPAFWAHQTWAHIVPDFDQAIIDGEVPISLNASDLPVKAASPPVAFKWRSVNSATESVLEPTATGKNPTLSSAINNDGIAWGTITGLMAELSAGGTTLSLANLELARKTQAFAALRRQFNGHSDEFLIDLLMDGIEIPDAAWKQPILLADQTTVFGMSKRYASDGASLTDSVVNGATMVDLRFSCPRVNVSGVIMLVAEIAPEQIFERQRDPYMHATTSGQLPQFLRDTLDPEKVEVVTNEMIDIDHDTPTATFGYAPLNHNWARSMPCIGGKFFRPDVDAGFDEDRQRLWAVETKNPVLSKDFYLTTAMHYKPFVVTDVNVDHFECLVSGNVSIRGNTVFGGLLVEATNDYAEVLEEAPMDRIDKPSTMEAQSDGPAEG